MRARPTEAGAAGGLERQARVPKSAGPPAVYRLALPWHLRTGPIPGARPIPLGAATLEGAVLPVRRTLRRSDRGRRAPDLASLPEPTGKILAVSLDAPATVERIRLDPGLPTGDEAVLELYRLDGDTPSAEPTVRAKATGRSVKVAASAFRARRFGLGLIDGGGSRVRLRPRHLDWLEVRNDPRGVVLGLVLRREDGPVTRVWRQPPPDLPGTAGEVTARFSAGDRLRAAFARLMSGLEGPVEERLRLWLVAEAGAPFALRLDRAELDYSLRQAAFADDPRAEKRVLRFSGDRGRSRRVRLRLPRGARVEAAELETVESFARPTRADGRETPVGSSGPGEGRDRAGRGAGLRLEPGRSWAVPWSREDAVRTGGVAVRLLSSALPLGVAVEIREDDGGPGGRSLARGEARWESGIEGWGVVRFDGPVVVSSAPHWVVLTCVEGRGVWRADEEAAEPGRVLSGPAKPAGRWSSPSDDAPEPDLRPVLPVTGERPGEGEAVTGAVSVKPVAPVRGAGGASAPTAPVDPEEDAKAEQPLSGRRSWRHDITVAARNALEDPGEEPGPVTVELELEAAAAGTVTVRPPVVRYGLREG